MDTSRVASTNNKFSCDLFKLIFAEKSEENVFLSPFSIAAAVAMTQLGAKESTAQGIKKTLCWQPDEGNQIHEQFQAYLSSLKTPSDKFSLSIASRIYSQESFKILDEFTANTSKYYLAEPVNADFINAAEEERSKINEWVSKETQDKIKDLIAQGVLNAMTRLVIVNAIYFKGFWEFQFNEQRTKAQDFRLAPGKTKAVPMMNTKQKFKTAISDQLNCRAIDIPYRGSDLSMVVILPLQDFGLKGLVEALDQDKLNHLLGNMSMAMDTSLSLPKFEVTSSHSLKEALSTLGMSDAFSMENADFSGITGGKDLFITAALHKAFIKVNEEGTEAAAATAMVFGMRCMPLPLEPFIADQPFLYIIKDNRANGLILFIGAVVDPSLQ